MGHVQRRRNCSPFANVATVTMQTTFTVSVISFIAVCTYRLVMISIERSETAQKSALEI